MGHGPATLRAAAVVQAAESAMVLVATVLVGVDTVAGRSYQQASGIALTLIGVGCAAALALVASGLARARRWSRTPALLTQLFVGIVGIYLLQGQRLDWGVPSVVLAVAGFAALLAPPSLRAMTAHDEEEAAEAAAGEARPRPDRPQPAPGPSGPASPPGSSGPASRPSRRRSARPGAE
ncbi:MAG TPA: hypothetical protein VLW44_20405 [Streptosporangiaceae bacterium]|nr:hypothetical protein [Streptosporangiaceae bacterium]